MKKKWLLEQSLKTLNIFWEKAKEGDYGAMFSWATHGTGYVTAQLATMLVIQVLVMGYPVIWQSCWAAYGYFGLKKKQVGFAALTADKVVTDSILKRPPNYYQ